MDPQRLLERIGYDGPLDPSLLTLAALQRAHALAVPFDALDCLLGNPVTVEPADAYRKVVDHRRGGFCFELNGLFGWLLETLGFAVDRVAARPVQGDGTLAAPFAHLALMVTLDRRWLVDVGFGAPWATGPLDVDERGVQVVDGRRFRIAEDGGELVAELLGPEPDAYRLTLDPVPQAAFASRCHEYATDAATSGFVRRGPVAQAYEDGWARLTRTRLTVCRAEERIDRELADDADWHRELEQRFGLVVEGSEVRGEAPAAGWRTHGSQVVYENAWIRVREDEVTRPDGGRGIYGVVETRHPSVFVVAVDEEDRVLLVTQRRYTTGRRSPEVPAGGADGEDPLEAARRELREETGYAADEWLPLGRLEAMNGICTEIQHVFLARGLRHVGGDRRAAEGITAVRLVPFDEVLAMVRRGEVTDGQTVSSLMLADLARRDGAAPAGA